MPRCLEYYFVASIRSFIISIRRIKNAFVAFSYSLQTCHPPCAKIPPRSFNSSDSFFESNVKLLTVDIHAIQHRLKSIGFANQSKKLDASHTGDRLKSIMAASSLHGVLYLWRDVTKFGPVFFCCSLRSNGRKRGACRIRCWSIAPLDQDESTA